MKDEQFEILVSLIKETASSLKKELQEEIMGVRYALFHEANEIKQEIKKNREANERQHQIIMSILEERYGDLKERVDNVEGDIKILHTLAKQNIEEHNKYDKTLAKIAND